MAIFKFSALGRDENAKVQTSNPCFFCALIHGPGGGAKIIPKKITASEQAMPMFKTDFNIELICR
jgi:hypothetical protein